MQRLDHTPRNRDEAVKHLKSVLHKLVFFSPVFVKNGLISASVGFYRFAFKEETGEIVGLFSFNPKALQGVSREGLVGEYPDITYKDQLFMVGARAKMGRDVWVKSSIWQQQKEMSDYMISRAVLYKMAADQWQSEYISYKLFPHPKQEGKLVLRFYSNGLKDDKFVPVDKRYPHFHSKLFSLGVDIGTFDTADEAEAFLRTHFYAAIKRRALDKTMVPLGYPGSMKPHQWMWNNIIHYFRANRPDELVSTLVDTLEDIVDSIGNLLVLGFKIVKTALFFGIRLIFPQEVDYGEDTKMQYAKDKISKRDINRIRPQVQFEKVGDFRFLNDAELTARPRNKPVINNMAEFWSNWAAFFLAGLIHAPQGTMVEFQGTGDVCLLLPNGFKVDVLLETEKIYIRYNPEWVLPCSVGLDEEEVLKHFQSGMVTEIGFNAKGDYEVRQLPFAEFKQLIQAHTGEIVPRDEAPLKPKIEDYNKEIPANLKHMFNEWGMIPPHRRARNYVKNAKVRKRFKAFEQKHPAVA